MGVFFVTVLMSLSLHKQLTDEESCILLVNYVFVYRLDGKCRVNKEARSPRTRVSTPKKCGLYKL